MGTTTAPTTMPQTQPSPSTSLASGPRLRSASSGRLPCALQDWQPTGAAEDVAASLRQIYQRALTLRRQLDVLFFDVHLRTRKGSKVLVDPDEEFAIGAEAAHLILEELCALSDYLNIEVEGPSASSYGLGRETT